MGACLTICDTRFSSMFGSFLFLFRLPSELIIAVCKYGKTRKNVTVGHVNTMHHRQPRACPLAVSGLKLQNKPAPPRSLLPCGSLLGNSILAVSPSTLLRSIMGDLMLEFFFYFLRKKRCVLVRVGKQRNLLYPISLVLAGQWEGLDLLAFVIIIHWK